MCVGDDHFFTERATALAYGVHLCCRWDVARSVAAVVIQLQGDERVDQRPVGLFHHLR